MLTCAAGQVALGGFAASSGSIVWGVITPIATVLFFGPERAMRWFYSYLGLIALLVVADPFVRAWADTPYGFSLLFFAINTVGPAAIGFLMIRYMDRQRRAARARSEELLLNVLPEAIANRLRSGEGVIAEQHAAVSVLFADVVDFTPYAEVTPPGEVVELLNAVFSDFDRLADAFGMEKIKTIGDAYMAVGGVPLPREDHADCALRMAIAMLDSVGRHQDARGHALTLRVGIASGPVVAGVIGRRKFIYDLWGDTVNTASRMESSGVPGRIQVTPETRRLLTSAYPFELREGVSIKGKGTMSTYLLDPARLRDASTPIIPPPMLLRSRPSRQPEAAHPAVERPGELLRGHQDPEPHHDPEHDSQGVKQEPRAGCHSVPKGRPWCLRLRRWGLAWARRPPRWSSGSAAAWPWTARVSGGSSISHSRWAWAWAAGWVRSSPQGRGSLAAASRGRP